MALNNRMSKFMDDQNMIWLFHGANGRFSSGVFSSKQKAEEWINKWSLSGILTKYPIDIGVYEWAIELNLLKISKGEQTQPEFIQRFTTASQEHVHYENGIAE
jgi:hypothetical protein